MGKKSKSKRNDGCCSGGFYDSCFRPFMGELIGTTLFVFLVTMSLNTAAGDAQSLTIAAIQGLGLAFLATAMGNVSGAHLNPALTVAAVISGATSFGLGIAYIIAQIAGSIGGAALTRSVLSSTEYSNIVGGITTLGATTEPVDGFFLESILTFILAIVFTVACLDYNAPGCGFAVGLVVFVDVLLGLDRTGASMNPARTLGPILVWIFDGEDYTWDDSWVYWGGPLAGAAVAAILYRFMLADPQHRKVCVDESAYDDDDSEMGMK